MGAPRIRRQRDHRHHRPRPGAARRHRLRRDAPGGTQGLRRRGHRRGRIGESRFRHLRAHRGRGHRRQRGARRRAREGERGRVRRVDVPHQAHQRRRHRETPRRRRLRESRRGLKPRGKAAMPDTPQRASARQTLPELEDHAAFERRHIGPDPDEQRAMLEALGFASRKSLIDAVVPAAIRRRSPMDLGPPRTEGETLSRLREVAEKNVVFKSYIGQGYYETYTPGVILRNVFQNPAWYTAYTPYQPEISQGRLEALLNFQTMVTDLTAMSIANASMLDEATAAAEAMTLCLRSSKGASRVFAVASDVFPQTLDVIRTRAEPLGIEVRVAAPDELAGIDAFAVLVQYPGAEGEVRDYAALAGAVHARGGFVIAAADLLALTLLKAPGEWGADVAVGNSQRFGVPMGFGGPHAGYMATPG